MVEEAIQNSSPVDAAAELAKILKSEQDRLLEIQQQIADLNAQFNAEKLGLEADIREKSDELAVNDSNYMTTLLESRARIQQAIVDEAQKRSDLANELAESSLLKTQSENDTAYKNAAQTQKANLLASRQEYLDAFEAYVDASKKTEYASEVAKQSNLAYQMAMDAANNELQATEVVNAQFIRDSAEKERQKIALIEDTAAKTLEHAALKYQNDLRDIEINVLNINIRGENGIISSIEYQQGLLDQAIIDLNTASENRQAAENNAAMLLQRLNNDNDIAANNLEEAKNELAIKTAREIELAAEAERERIASKLQMDTQNAIKSNSVTIMQNIQETIDMLEDDIAAAQNRKSELNTTIAELTTQKEDLNTQLQELLVSSGGAALIADEDARLARLELETRLEINALRIEKTALINEYNQSFQDANQNTSDSMSQLLRQGVLEQELSRQIELKQQYRTQVAYDKDLIKNYNIYQITKDIDASILFSLNKNINGINNEIVLRRLKTEHQYFDKYQNAMKLYVHQSEGDAEINKLDSKSMDAGTHFLIHLSIIISIFVFINNQFNLNAALIIAFVLFIIAIVVYYARMFQRVRTRARNFYWNDISKEKSNNL
jgi:hypothetical protein